MDIVILGQVYQSADLLYIALIFQEPKKCWNTHSAMIPTLKII